MRFFAVDPENTETLLFQPLIKKGVAIHKIGKGLIDALLVSGWVESNPMIVGIGNEQKEANSAVNKDFMIFPKSTSSTRIVTHSNLNTSSYGIGYDAYRLDKKGVISESETGLYVQRNDGKMEKIFSYEGSYQTPRVLDQFCGKNPIAYFAEKNMDVYAKTCDGLIKLMNVGRVANGASPRTYIRYLYAMVEPEKPKCSIDKTTNSVLFAERFFNQELEVIETEYLFGQPIYTTYPLLPGKCNVQLSSEDSDVTIVARNKAGKTMIPLRQTSSDNTITVAIDRENITVRSKTFIRYCRVRSIMSADEIHVNKYDQYTYFGTIHRKGSFIATVVDNNNDTHTVRFIIP